MDFRIILTLLFLLTLTTTKPCSWGEVSINQKCLNCRYIPNTNINAVEQALFREQCPCKQGFVWSKLKKECRPIYLQKNTNILADRLESNFTEGSLVQMGESQRILQTTSCSQQGGFILYQNLNPINSAPVVCYNCRLTPNGLSTIGSTTCGCYYGFSFLASWGQCYCFQYRYIDPLSSQCKSCASAGSLMSQCRACTAPFYRVEQGCIYMPTFPNGVSGGCATGYYFGWQEQRCICDYYGNYSISANGVCTKCASTDSVCINCKPPYYLDKSQNYQCIHGSLLTNTDYATATTTTACKTGAIPKLNPYEYRIVGCACSYAVQYYQNSQGVCVACSASLPAGVSLSDCQECAISAKFYKGSVECIYCPGITYTVATGTATVNGCDCLANYYWNALTDKCECDFVLGFIGGAISPCIKCENIANTDVYPIFNACSCKPGYKWNSQTKICDCDTSNGLSFLSSGSCVSCGLMPGAIKLGTDSQSCTCVYGYFWNPTSKKCECDSSKNYAINYKGLCADCMDTAYSNGLASNGGCACINGFSWDSGKGFCNCPAGSVVIGRMCVSCSSASLPATATVADCTACSNSKNFATAIMGCFSCPSQTASTGTVSGGVCACGSDSVWRPALGVCACDWTKYVYTKYLTATTFSCRTCSFSASTPSRCSCNSYDPVHQICTDSSSDSNFVTAGTFVGSCKPGFYWTQTSLPYRCASGYGAFTGYNSVSTNTNTACGSTDTACLRCDPTGGYLYVSATNQCIKCSTVTSSTAAATINGCVCNANFQWNGATLTCIAGCLTGQIFSTSSNSCVCDTTKSIVVSGTCIPCSTITNSNGVAASNSCGCNSPNTWSSLAAGGGACCGTNQFALSSTSCFTCTSGNGGTGQRSGSGCGCSSPYTWSGTSKTCVPPTCLTGQIFSTSSNACICDTTKSIVVSGTCTPCNTVANSNGVVASSTSCGCNSPNTWSALTAGGGACCGTNQIALSSTSCFTCTSGNGGTGQRSGSGCGCSSPYTWSGSSNTCVPPTCLTGQIFSTSSNSCVCDTTKSIVVSGTCTPCNTITNSNGVAASATACGCNPPNTWSALAAGGGVCCGANQYAQTGNTCYTCTTANGGTGLLSGSGCGCTSPLLWSDASKTCATIVCSPTTQLTLNTGCFNCPNTAPGTGLVVGTDCGSVSLYKWSPSSKTCICDYSIAYQSSTSCIKCPTGTTSGDGSGGCICTLSTDRWQINACKSCTTLTNTILLSGNCFVCGTSGTNTLATKTTNTSCTCMAKLTWNPSGFCDCGTTSALITIGNTVSCFICANATANTLAKTGISTCSCVSNTLTWSSTKALCDCGTTLNGVVFGGATANVRCLSCTPSTYMVGPSADRKSCVCIGKLSWVTASNTCGCTSPTTMVIIGSNFNTQCLNCSSIPYAMAVPASLTTCNCIATGMTFSSNLGTCSCPANNVILPSNTCSACPTGATPYTTYECLCAPGSVWIPAQGCIQCGSNALPNSLSTGGTNFACACNTGFIWDVMTEGCIASTCNTITASCMKCPSGTAAALVAINAKNLAGGAAIQILLAGSFTNYNLIKGFQCTCAPTQAWDSMRLACYPKGLV